LKYAVKNWATQTEMIISQSIVWNKFVQQQWISTSLEICILEYLRIDR
jgi:hypothetical protein